MTVSYVYCVHPRLCKTDRETTEIVHARRTEESIENVVKTQTDQKMKMHTYKGRGMRNRDKTRVSEVRALNWLYWREMCGRGGDKLIVQACPVAVTHLI